MRVFAITPCLELVRIYCSNSLCQGEIQHNRILYKHMAQENIWLARNLELLLDNLLRRMLVGVRGRLRLNHIWGIFLHALFLHVKNTNFMRNRISRFVQ